MPANFVNIDRDTPFLLPPNFKQWVGQDGPVHFIIEAVAGQDIGLFKVNHRVSGSKQYPPKAQSADEHDPGPDGGEALPKALAKRQGLLDKLKKAKAKAPRVVKHPTLLAMKQKLETNAGKSRCRQRQEVS